MSRYEVTQTPAGLPTLLYRDGIRVARIHSAYDPVAEAERAAAGFNPGRATTVAVAGLGLGYHIAALKRRFPGLTFIAVERDPEVVAAAQKNCPHNLEGVAIVTSISGIADIFETVDMSSFRGVARYLHRPSYLLDRDFYDAVFNDIAQYAASKISDLLTRLEFEERWVMNILANIHHIFSACPVRRLFGAFRGCPGVIVSAGPSLRKNVSLLEPLRQRAVIIAVDTAIGVLNKSGVNPHIVMTLDAQRHSVRHFFGWRGDAILCADIVSYPPVMREWKGLKVISATSKYYTSAEGKTVRETTPLMGWIEQYTDSIGDIQSGGSVATSAFDLLLNMGCACIILVGQDLAYTGREIHCSGTYHNDEWLPRVNRLGGLDAINQGVIRRRKIKRVAAYGGQGTVVSDFVFDLYRSWFEDSARKVAIPILNATEGGARIIGAIEQSLAGIIENLPILNPTPEEILGRIMAVPQSVKPIRLIEAMRAAISHLRLLGDALDKGGELSRVEECANAEIIRPILQPFMRRSRLFAARYQASASVDEASAWALNDIRAAVTRLLPAMKDAVRRLEESAVPR